jgi:hypothetical protein
MPSAGQRGDALGAEVLRLAAEVACVFLIQHVGNANRITQS